MIQVLTLMADGLANAEIASQLVLSVRTVTTPSHLNTF